MMKVNYIKKNIYKNLEQSVCVLPNRYFRISVITLNLDFTLYLLFILPFCHKNMNLQKCLTFGLHIKSHPLYLVFILVFITSYRTFYFVVL